ncbi:hypothetical protein CDAR_27881 [Caerostris darwini]|uniref:Uncharacterized protein n=1 Tax=Caerostris darwini TaxID=1538125 RepID=A0AAV4MUK5_9ARAC|nr:hypothetical protein CDAR_27881 [Caerostris darwini]
MLSTKVVCGATWPLRTGIVPPSEGVEHSPRAARNFAPGRRLGRTAIGICGWPRTDRPPLPVHCWRASDSALSWGHRGPAAPNIPTAGGQRQCAPPNYQAPQ